MMKIKVNKVFGAGLIASALLLGATGAFAAPPPPPPPGVVLAPGTAICPRCDGHRRVPSGFLGWKSKRCPNCKGTGVVALRHHHRPAPPPPPRARKPAPPPRPHARKPAPPPKPHAGRPVQKGPSPGNNRPGPKKPGRR